MMDLRAAQLISEYQEAFRKANPGLPSPIVQHDGNGKFTITTSVRGTPILARELIERTERLKGRAKERVRP